MLTHNTYSISPFVLSSDVRLNKGSRRCLNRRERMPNEEDLRTLPSYANRFQYPIHQRFVSPYTDKHLYRAPYLPEQYWKEQEDTFEHEWPQVGIRIQIFSTMSALNFRTVYIIERTAHPLKPWKRLILTHHVSESDIPFRPHVVEELTIYS